MDVTILARAQFAFTIMFHYIFASLSIGLTLMLVVFEGLFIKTKKPIYKTLAHFWTKILALTFVFGVSTGVVMEFEFGTNWAAYSRFVGDIFGSPLAAEGIFSFFLESVFLGVLVFGWNRVSTKTHFFSTLMVALGAHLSALWIIVANSWMHTPTGFQIVGEGSKRHAEITDFWAMFFNPSMPDRLLHVIGGAYLGGAFLVIGVAAYYLRIKKHEEFSKISLKMAGGVALISLLLQFITGDTSARTLATTAPEKLAVYEGIFKTQRGAPLTVFGLINEKEERIDYQICAPKLLSFMAYGDCNAEVQGIETIPPADRPHVPMIFQTYHLMVATWGFMLLTLFIAFWYWRKGMAATPTWLLYLLIGSSLIPQIGNQAGWVATEMVRYPWIVHNQLRISDGLSKTIQAEQIIGSIILFLSIYLLLLSLYIFLFCKKISEGPKEEV